MLLPLKIFYCCEEKLCFGMEPYVYARAASIIRTECRLGKKIPSAGDTPACKSYAKQSTLFTTDYYCKACARWEYRFISGRCIKDYPSPKGKDSDACKYFVKG